MMSWIIEIVLGNIPAIIAGLGTMFGLGWIYRKGRIHSKAKSDKELRNAVEDFKDDAEAAANAGDGISDSELRDDDGHRRD